MDVSDTRKRAVELLAIVLLSVAGVATSWSGYQAARWGGVQSIEFGRASALRVESTRASATADQLVTIDVGVFMSWVDALAAEDTMLARFYEERFRDEFRPAFEAWIESQPLKNPDAARTPFQLPEYNLPKLEEAGTLMEQAERTFAHGVEANSRSDAYVLNAVILATVLFFSGIAQQFRIFAAQVVLLSIASVLLVVGVINIATMPKLF